MLQQMSWTGYQKLVFCLKQGRKIRDSCLKQGQGLGGRAAPPYPRFCQVPPPGPDGERESVGRSLVQMS